MLFALVRIIGLSGLFIMLVACGGKANLPPSESVKAADNSGEVPLSECPAPIVGYWTDAKDSFLLSNLLIRFHSDGKVERVLPEKIKNRPNVIGRFTYRIASDDKTIKLRLKVDPNVTAPEVISLPFEFSPGNNDNATFQFTTSFYKVQATKPVGPNGFWGPGVGVGLPLGRATDDAIGSEIKLELRRVSQSDVDRFRQDYLREMTKSEAEMAQRVLVQELNEKSAADFIKVLEGGFWTLEKAELFDRRTGVLVVREQRSSEWNKGKTEIFQLYDSAKELVNFSVSKAYDAQTFNFRFSSGNASLLSTRFTQHHGRRFFSGRYLDYPLEMDSQHYVLGVVNGLMDFKDFWVVLSYRHQATEPQDLPDPPIFNYSDRLTELDDNAVEKSFSKKVAGSWHLQSIQRTREILKLRKAVIVSETPYDPSTLGVNSKLDKPLPYRLIFSQDKVIVNGEPSVEFNVGTQRQVHFIRTRDTTSPADGLYLLGKFDNLLQLGFSYSNGDLLILNYGPVEVAQSSIASSPVPFLTSLEEWDRLEEVGRNKVFEITKIKFNRLLERWKMSPEKTISVPVWLADLLGISPENALQVTYDLIKNHQGNFQFLDGGDLLRLNLLLENTLR
jgi:hypothetical protein